MSEAFITAAFLSASGGLQDAYTYSFRGKVFANAQTGNIVLLSESIFNHDLQTAVHYLVPLLFFACGVAVAELFREQFQHTKRIHWRQSILIMEILLLFLVGFLPEELDMLANALVSFSCAMQVQTFRKVNGCSFASTMCIGNIRSCMEAICTYITRKERKKLDQAIRYFLIILLFALGAGAGSCLIVLMGQYAIWISCLLLIVSFTLMFIREEIEEGR